MANLNEKWIYSPYPLTVGTIGAVKNDPAGQTNGASGPFVLFNVAD